MSFKKNNSKKSAQGAQLQHYVPQFMLRQFSLKDKKDQVAVFDKNTGRIFTPSIKDIMAERRYNDFKYQEVMFSFENTMTRCENEVVETYRQLLKCRTMPAGDKEIGHLAMLIALQFSRTKNRRQMFLDLENQLTAFVAKSGHSIQDVEGWEPLDENNLKKRSISFIAEAFPEFSAIILGKDIFLMEAAPKTTFYISDDPVVLHNENKSTAWSTIGLSVKGIQISMPISRDLQLCAWCPSILDEIFAETARQRPHFCRQQFSRFLSGSISSNDVTKNIEMYDARPKKIINAIEHGVPVRLAQESMDFYNAKQVGNAARWIISPEKDFDLAIDFIRRYPEKRSAVSLS